MFVEKSEKVFYKPNKNTNTYYKMISFDENEWNEKTSGSFLWNEKEKMLFIYQSVW